MGISVATPAFLPLLAVAQQADNVVEEEEGAGVTFFETVAHLGGLPVLGGAVLLLALAYLALVEWLLPRGRRLHQLKARQINSAAPKRE